MELASYTTSNEYELTSRQQGHSVDAAFNLLLDVVVGSIYPNIDSVVITPEPTIQKCVS
jgi:hypothetical protein